MHQNYTTMNNALTLKVEFSIPKDHRVRLISRFVDFIPKEVLLKKLPIPAVQSFIRRYC